jgi:hypothetical protein
MALVLQLSFLLGSSEETCWKSWRRTVMTEPVERFMAAMNEMLISVSVWTFRGKNDSEDSLNAPTGCTY